MQSSQPTDIVVNSVKPISDAVLDSVHQFFMAAVERLPYFIAGIIVLLLFWLIGLLVRKIFLFATKKAKLDHRLRILFARLILVASFVSGLFTAFSIVVPSFGFGNLIAGFGLSSFVVGFATKDILNNLLSGVLILWREPFRIGDSLSIGNNQGVVEYIGMRATTLRKDDGERVLMPNGEMYASAITIRSAGSLRRMDLSFCIGYGVDVGFVKSLTTNILTGTAGVVEAPKPRVVVTELSDDGVKITANFWIDTTETVPIEIYDKTAVEIVTCLNENKIEMFPSGPIVQEPNVKA